MAGANFRFKIALVRLLLGVVLIFQRDSAKRDAVARIIDGLRANKPGAPAGGCADRPGDSKKLHIAQVCFRFGAPGGAEKVVLDHSRELVKMGHRVTVVTTDLYTETPWKRMDGAAGRGSPKRETVDGIEVLRLDVLREVIPFLQFPVIPDLVRVLSELDCDIYNAHSHNYYQVPATYAASGISGRPFVVTLHYHPPEERLSSFRRLVMLLSERSLFREVYRHASAIIHVSGHERKFTRDFVDPQKGRVVWNAIDTDSWDRRPMDGSFGKKFGIPAGKPYVLYAGRLARNKGLAHLVDAMPQVIKAHPAAKLVLVGKDWGEEKGLKVRLRELGIEDRAIFTGHIDDEMLYMAAFEECAAFVLPSEWEAFGLVLAEAMYCGRPVIGTRVGGIPSVIDDGENGYLVDYGQPAQIAQRLCDLLSSPALCAELGQAGRKKAAEKFSLKSTGKALEAVYRDAICQESSCAGA